MPQYLKALTLDLTLPDSTTCHCHCCCCCRQAASKLALTMSQYLKALTLDSATSRDVAPSAMAAAHQAASASSAAGASRGPSSAGPLSSAVSTADTDAGECSALVGLVLLCPVSLSMAPHTGNVPFV
jgi:hypothetical protein